MINRVEMDALFQDDRGSLVQLVHGGFEQVNVLITRQGVTRGGHYHKIACERFYIVSGSVVLSALKDGTSAVFEFGTGDYFEVEPLTVHSMFFPEDTVMVVLYDKCVVLADGCKDIYPA
jgi:dTDP-4-dehydrorhamnose 3,5-epimerase-like enzyme